MISNCFISFKQVISLISLRPTFKYTISLASFKIRISLIRFVNKFKCFNWCAFFKKCISVNWQNFASKISRCSTFVNFSKFFKRFLDTFNSFKSPKLFNNDISLNPVCSIDNDSKWFNSFKNIKWSGSL